MICAGSRPRTCRQLCMVSRWSSPNVSAGAARHSGPRIGSKASRSFLSFTLMKKRGNVCVLRVLEFDLPFLYFLDPLESSSFRLF